MSGTAAQVAAHSRGSSPPPRRSALAGTCCCFRACGVELCSCKLCRREDSICGWNAELKRGSEGRLAGCGVTYNALHHSGDHQDKQIRFSSANKATPDGKHSQIWVSVFRVRWSPQPE